MLGEGTKTRRHRCCDLRVLVLVMVRRAVARCMQREGRGTECVEDGQDRNTECVRFVACVGSEATVRALVGRAIGRACRLEEGIGRRRRNVARVHFMRVREMQTTRKAASEVRSVHRARAKARGREGVLSTPRNGACFVGRRKRGCARSSVVRSGKKDARADLLGLRSRGPPAMGRCAYHGLARSY